MDIQGPEGGFTTKPDITEQTLYVPYSEDVLASVWCVDPDMQLITNVPEELAQMNASDFPKHIYFFAELIMGNPGVEIYDAYAVEVSHVGEGEEEPEVLHRDAGTGQFVTEEFADEHPETTVTENNS